LLVPKIAYTKNPGIVPSFKTYLINRTYYLRLSVKVWDKLSDQTFQLETRVPFSILPMEQASLSSRSADFLLPSYSEAVLPSPAFVEHASGE